MTARQPTPGPASFRKRYVYKVGAAALTAGFSFLTQAVVSRGLGPVVLGDFGFLSAFFTSVLAFFDMGTSICFYTRLSQRPEDAGLVAFYARFAAVVCLVTVSLIAATQAFGWEHVVWPDQEMPYVYLAAGWGALTWLGTVGTKLVDAYGFTVAAEKARVFIRALALGLAVGLWVVNRLTLGAFFVSSGAVLALFCLMMMRTAAANPHLPRRLGAWRALPWRPYVADFAAYSRPLLLSASAALALGMVDRWMLQTFAGSKEQGFFTLSTQIGAACFLFSGAMTPLLAREFAVAYGERDLRTMGRLFRRFLPPLYAVAAVLACFVAVEAGPFAALIGGDRYRDAAVPIAIMALFPVGQTYSQLSGAVYYATDRTSVFARVSVVAAVLALPVTYLLVGPSGQGGLALGATGLALKTLGMQLLVVNVLLWFNTRFLRQPFGYYLAHQVLSVAAFLACAWLADRAVGMFQGDAHLPAWGRLGAVGAAYGVLALGLTLAVPWLAGLSRIQRNSGVARLRSVVRQLVRGA